MRILQIASQIPVPPTDGGKLSVWGVTKSLVKLGYKIDFVCYRNQNNYSESYELLSKYCTPYILNVRTDNNILGAVKNLFSSVPYNASKYYRKELVEFIKEYFLKNEVDIVQVEHLHMGWIVDEIRKFTSAKIILRQQNLETMIMKRFYENQQNPLLKFFAKMQFHKFITYEPMICKKFDMCVMISKIDEQKLRSMNKNINSCVIPAAVNDELFNHKKKNTIPFSLVHIGHIDWYPNLDGLNWFVNDILPQVVKHEPRTKLFVYGGGSTKHYKIPNNLQKNIEVVGFVDNLWKHLENKSLAVVPLRIGGGIRIKILELLATGTNLITTDVGKEGIEISHNKEVLVANSKDDFINMILDYFRNKFNSKELSSNGQNFIKNNYTWDKIGYKFEKLYKKLFNGKIN